MTDESAHLLTHAILELTAAVRGGHCKHETNILLARIEESEKRIMSQITDWAAKEQANLDAVSGTLDGIVKGIADLDAKITALQNSPGTLSAADQAALDSIVAASGALVTKSAAISTAPPPP